MPRFPDGRPPLSDEEKARVIRSLGGTLPHERGRANREAAEMYRLAKSDPAGPDGLDAVVKKANAALIGDFSRRRRVSSLAKTSTVGGLDMIAALPRFYDPIEYWELSGIPWNIHNETHRHKLYKWLRLFYMTHYLVPILIDIFTRFPLVGMELTSQDQKLTDWYTDLFLDRLDYQEFLVRLGREYWTVGQAFPLGSFNETLGIWEREELINPEDVVIQDFPLLGTQQFSIKPPEYLRELAQHRRPAREFRMLATDFPDLIPYLRNNENIPVSDMLMKQVAFKINDWDTHGTPILLRGLRTLMHEEKLLASQDAIAERLYSPLILAKMGVQDLGDGQPWLPSPDELDAFRDDMDIALSSDFRLLVHHFGVDISNVFGREQMPNLGDDFDRVERRLMQLFGVNPSLLSAGENAQPYASSALQAEFLNQILRTYQNYLKKHFKARAELVAEANEHYDYEKRGDRHVPIYEEKIVYDEEGNATVEKKPKLLIPDLEMKVLDMRDEATQRQFLTQLKASGVPISDSTFMVGMPSTFEDELEKMEEEMIQKTVAQQEAKLKAYRILQAKGLPIPADLKAEVEQSGLMGSMPGADNGSGAPPGMTLPPGGMPPPGMGSGIGVDVPQQGDQILMPPPPGGAPPMQGIQPGPAGAVPQMSHERTPLSKYEAKRKVSVPLIDKEREAERQDDEPEEGES